MFLVAQLSPKRGVLLHKNSLASCHRYRHSVEPRALTFPFKHSDLIAWSLLSWHPTHKYLWGKNDIVGGAHRDIAFLLQRHQARDCAHVTVGAICCVEEGVDHHRQETGLKRDFDSSRKKWTFGSGPLLCQRFWRRREETACKRKRTEISLVFVTIMLLVLTYVVSNELFWNWNGVVRFVSQEVWFDKGFVI